MDTLRQCVKVGLAVGLAYLLTYGNNDYFALYSVLTAALVVGESLGEDIGQSLVRLVGTVIGAAVGVTALLVAGAGMWPAVVAVAACIWLSRQLQLEQLWRATVAVCLVTLLLHPQHVTEYGLYRLANTLIGAAVGLAVSLLVWPVRAADVSEQVLAKLMTLSADLLATAAAADAAARPAADQTVQQLARMFKSLKDARREERAFLERSHLHTERAILGGQVGLGALAVATAGGRLAGNPAARPFLDAVGAVAKRLAERARAVASPTGDPPPPPDPLHELPTPPADAGLSETEGVLIAGVAGELRVIAAALAVLERLPGDPVGVAAKPGAETPR